MLAFTAFVASAPAKSTSSTATPAIAVAKPAAAAVAASSGGTHACSAFGNPHIERVDGSTLHHLGKGEYQLLALPGLQAEVHYYGCDAKAVDAPKPHGSYIGALALKLGTAAIEIVGNELSVVGGDTYTTRWDDDAAMGPYEIDAGGTKLVVEREALPAKDVKGFTAANSFEGDEEHGVMLYRWKVSTADGFVLHSHAARHASAKDLFALDFAVSYPEEHSQAAMGLCVDQSCAAPQKMKGKTPSDADCGNSAACLPVNASAAHGVAPIFTTRTLHRMADNCPHTVLDATCPMHPPSGVRACELLGKPMRQALVACVHLSGISGPAAKQYHDACVFDWCTGAGAFASQDMWAARNPPALRKCKAAPDRGGGDPRFTSFSTFQFDFLGEGAYRLLGKERGGDQDPCAVEVQAFECAAPCPGPLCGRSYAQAIGIKAHGGTGVHEVVLHGENCLLNGAPCLQSAEEGQNVGADGVKLLAYKPTKEHEQMGDYGPGYKGWFVHAAGFEINVTMTRPGLDAGTGVLAMNVVAFAPAMCMQQASGLCMAGATTRDTLLQGYGESYLLGKDKKERERLEAQPAAADKPPAYDPSTHSAAGGDVPMLVGAGLAADPKGDAELRAAAADAQTRKQQEEGVLSGGVNSLAVYPALAEHAIVGGLRQLECPAVFWRDWQKERQAGRTVVDSLSRTLTAESVAASYARDYEAEQKAKDGSGSPLVP